MIDTHCHLDQMADPDAVLKRCASAGVTGVLAPAMGLASLQKLEALAERHPGLVRIAAGVHPERPMGPDLLDEARTLAAWIDAHHERLIAIGEVGLPSYNLPDGTIPPVAFTILDLFLERAIRWDLPLILHAVHDSAAPCLARLQHFGVRRAVFHWLKAPLPVQQQILNAGYYASCTPEVTVLARDQALAHRFFPDRLLVETDGPEPLRIPRPGPSDPSWIAEGITWLSRESGASFQETARCLDRNAAALFGPAASFSAAKAPCRKQN